MAVTYDQGAHGVHSPHKQPVAHRLTLALRQVALGETLAAATEQGPELTGACVQSFDDQTNMTEVLVKLSNAQGLFLNATAACSDCCSTAGRRGMFHVSVASPAGGEQWVEATMRINAGSTLLVTAALGNLQPTLMDGHGVLRKTTQQIFGLRFAAGNLPQCAVLNGAGLPLPPFNAVTIAPACKLAGWR